MCTGAFAGTDSSMGRNTQNSSINQTRCIYRLHVLIACTSSNTRVVAALSVVAALAVAAAAPPPRVATLAAVAIASRVADVPPFLPLLSFAFAAWAAAVAAASARACAPGAQQLGQVITNADGRRLVSCNILDEKACLFPPVQTVTRASQTG